MTLDTPSSSQSEAMSAALGQKTGTRLPKDWQRALKRSERQVAEKHYGPAIASLKDALDAGADAYDCCLRIAELYRLLQEWPLAMAFAERAAKIQPTRASAHEKILELAVETCDNRRVMAAGAILIKLCPRYVPAYSALGNVYLQQGETQAALRMVNILIRFDPQNPDHHFRKALLCQDQGDIAAAIHEFSQVLILQTSGPCFESAKEALETLDIHQLNQIITLALEDLVFRSKLEQDPERAIDERGFSLSVRGKMMLAEFSSENLGDFPPPPRPMLYH
jgi:tetratricopeptide (TPR) repeat protein